MKRKPFFTLKVQFKKVQKSSHFEIKMAKWPSWQRFAGCFAATTWATNDPSNFLKNPIYTLVRRKLGMVYVKNRLRPLKQFLDFYFYFQEDHLFFKQRIL